MTQKKLNLKFKIIFITIAVLLLTIVFVGIFWYQNSRTNQSSNNQPNLQTLEPAPKPQPEAKLEVDLAGYKISKSLREITGVEMGFIWSDNLISLNQAIPVEVKANKIQVTKEESATYTDLLDFTKPRLRDLISIPTEKTKTNWLSIPDYGVEAPIIYASFQDFFEQDKTKSENIVDFSKPIQEDKAEVNKGNYESVPVQRLLRDGVVHLPFSTHPGELGHSFIVGHSSNFSTVQSDYNEVFKPIERKTKVGDIFYIYDFEGRKLKFEVFEAISVSEEDVSTAYRTFPNSSFPDKDRVVTLQASILETVNGRLEPTKRWLTRGQLVLE
jgi:hypothetical protein